MLKTYKILVTTVLSGMHGKSVHTCVIEFLSKPEALYAVGAIVADSNPADQVSNQTALALFPIEGD